MSTRILLDTHALLWYDSEPDRLSATSRAVIQRRETIVLCSAASIYELWQKAMKPKSPIQPEHVESVLRHLPVYGFTLLPIETNHAANAAILKWSNRDPFDRIIAAQAIAEDCSIVTCDTAFKRLKNVRIVW
ncbi:MAG: type II toxin-antitoxin system VapC family toxin [Candidatus Kapabacteria bacterium]|nr:type II toxin-antitoxin system VapC family toxin [Candidatus Kapabacteria bacterium]